jgi:hypothetical protein
MGSEIIPSDKKLLEVYMWGFDDGLNGRNEINTNVSVIDQQIIEYRKKIELAKLMSAYNLEISKGITDEILKQRFIEKWDGKTPLYGNAMPVQLFKNVK